MCSSISRRIERNPDCNRMYKRIRRRRHRRAASLYLSLCDGIISLHAAIEGRERKRERASLSRSFSIRVCAYESPCSPFGSIYTCVCVYRTARRSPPIGVAVWGFVRGAGVPHVLCVYVCVCVCRFSSFSLSLSFSTPRVTPYHFLRLLLLVRYRASCCSCCWLYNALIWLDASAD